MTKTHSHNRLIHAIWLVVVLLCSGFAGFGSAAVTPESGGQWSNVAQNAALFVFETRSLASRNHKTPHHKELHNHSTESEVSAQTSAQQHGHHGMPCSPDCDTAPTCHTLCAMACSASAFSPGGQITNIVFVDGNPSLTLWAHAHVIDGPVLPPLFRPPIV